MEPYRHQRRRKSQQHPTWTISLFMIIFFCNFYQFSIDAAPTSPSCNEGCASPPLSSNGQSKYTFKPGTLYNYNLDSAIQIYLAGADNQDTSLHVQAQVQLYADANCMYTLRIPQMFVFGPDKKKTKLSDDLTIQKPIRFSMANGEIAPEICADDNDSEFGLNIKRAVISMIQSTEDSKKTYETDVFGTCPTIFSQTKAGADTTIVTKSRNLNGCGYRELIANGLVTGIFNEQSEVKSTPLLNGDYSSEQRIKNGILQSAIVNEEYTYVPFSAGEAGVRTKIVTKLVAKGKPADTATTVKVQSPAPRSIIFQDADQVAANENMKETIVKALRQTLDTYENNVGPRAASQFTELIRLMRYAKESDFAAIYSQVKSGTIQSKTVGGVVQQKGLIRKIFLDALFRTGTGYSVQFLASLLKSQEITDDVEKRLAYISFNLVQSMTKEALQSVNKLFDGNPPKEAYLSIGNLVNKYCRKHGCESNEIKSISENFVKKLINCKSDGNKQQENQIVAVLKGLRNTNNLVNPALDKVVNCATNEKLSARIRVAAIQSMVANPCADKIQNTAMNTLKNTNEDSEIRIESYLVLTRCPNGRIASELKALLDSEKVYQVGAFIQTHLASLRASTDIHRADIRHHFAQIRSEQQFPFDFRRYSFNREFSYQMNSLGIGASLDTSVIYSQLDFLPKSMHLNFTAELFGNNFNLMEFSGRQENINTLLEHNFGPKGVFSTESAAAFLQSVFDNYQTVIADVEARKEKLLGGFGRTRRGTREDLKQFQRLVKLGNEIYDDIDVDLSLKLFGTEMYFLSLGDNIPVNSKEFLLKANECIGKMLRHAKGFSHTIESHALFLDGKLVYPSGVGFPIKLLAQGAGVLRAEFNGKIDVEAIAREPRDMKINLKIVPSYNIELTGKLVIDGWAVTTGLQVSAAVHTSTGADIDFKLINDGQGQSPGFDLNVKSPLRKQEIFSFDHRILFITQERGRETIQQNLKFSSPKKEFSDCFDQLYKNIGITFCGDVSITVPGNPGVAPFPLTGPNKASISLEVDSEYNFRGIYNNKNPKHQIVNFIFDTPKSEHRRRTEITLETSIEPKIFVRGSIQAPYAQVSAEAGFTNNPKEISLYAQANNGPSEYLIKLGFNKLGSGGGGAQQEYSPIVIYQTPSIKDDNLFGYRVTGKILVDSSKQQNTRYNFNDIQLKATNDPDPFKINGWLDFDKQKISTDLALEKSFRKGSVIGTVSFGSGQVNVDLTVKTNFHDLANGRLIYEMIRNDGQYKNDFTFVYGPDLESLTKRIEFMQNYNYERQPGNNNAINALQFKNKLRLGFLQIHLRVDGEYSKNLVKYDVEGGYAKHKLGSSLNGKLNGKTTGDYDIEFAAWINHHTIRLFADREIDNGKSKFSNRLVTSFGAKFEVNGIVGHRLSKQDADITLNGVFIFAEKQDPYKITFILLMTPTEITSNGKLTLAVANAPNPTELIDYQMKATRADITKGTFELAVKDVLAAKGTFKTNAVNGQGDAMAIINLKKLGRKVKFDSAFVRAKPIFNFKIDLFYDFEKDNTKKITFDTKNKMTRSSINSDNSLTILTEKYQFNVNGELEGQSIHNGKLNGDFKLILPTQQQITGTINREIHISTTDQKITGKIFAKLTDQMPNKKMRTLQLDGELSDGDYRSKLFNMWHKLEYVDFSGRNVAIKATGKHLPVQGGHHHQYKMGGGNIEISGTMLNEPMDMELMISEYCHEHAVYNFLAHYGKQIKFNVNGRHFLGGRAKPTTYEIKLTVDAPNTPMKLIKFESDGKFLAPQTETGLYEIHLNGMTTLNDKVIRLNTNGKGNGRLGSGALTLQLPDLNPLSLDGSYSYSNEAAADDATESETSIDNHHGQCEFNVKYGAAKEVKFTGDLKTQGANSITFHTTLYSSPTTAGDTPKDIDFYFKSSKLDHVYSTAAKLTSNKNLYSIDSTIAISETNPSIDLTIVYPMKEPIKLQGGFDRLGPNKYKGQMRIENFGQFNFNGVGEVSYQNVDNFYVKCDADSELLKLNKIHMEVTSKHGAGGQSSAAGRGIEFKASSAGKNILSGNAEYTVKEEKGKTTIEGQGNVKLADKNRDVSFTFVKNRYEEATDKETGIFLIFTGTVGPKNVVAELKLTNRNFVIRNSVCEEREQCINFEVRSAFKESNIERLKHELLVSIDLRKLGYPYEFGLKAETERNGFLINHNLDMHLQSQDKVKYQYNVYVQSKKAGIVLQLPARTMSMEAIYALPNNEVFGVYEVSVTTYMDKVKRPQNNCQIGFRGEMVRVTPMHIRTTGDLHFTHTAMKPMKISLVSAFNGDEQSADAKMEIDIFNDRKNAVIISGKYSNSDRTYRGFNVTSSIGVDSQGLGFNYGFTGHIALSLAKRQLSVSGSGTSPTSELRAAAFAFISGDKIQIIITGFNEDLLTIDGSYDAVKQTGHIQMIMKLLAATPITITGKFNGLTAYNFKLIRPNLIDVSGDLTVGNEAKLVIVGGGKDLYSGRIALNPAQFLASEYKVNDEEIKSFIKVAQKEFRLDTERVRNDIMQRIQKVQVSLVQQFNKIVVSFPDYSGVRTEYREEFEKIMQELMSDKSIKAFVEFFQRIYATVGKSIADIIQGLSESSKKVYEIVNEFMKKLLQSFNTDILPALTETYNRITTLLYNLYEDTVNLIVTLVERAMKALKSFEEDFTKIGKIISDIVRNVATVIQRAYEVISKEFMEFYRLLVDNIKALPGYDDIRARIDKYLSSIISPENLVKILHEIRDALRDTAPTIELSDFVQQFSSYLENKIMKRANVNDIETLKTLYISFLKAIRSVIDLVYRHSSDQIGSIKSSVSGGSGSSSTGSSSSLFGGGGDSSSGGGGGSFFSPIPYSIAAFKRLPYLSTMKFSPWNYLRNERFISLQDLLYTYRPSQFNPMKFLPPFSMYGQIIDGITVFTFDGEYVQFRESTCSYILAQDFYNNNFSIVAGVNQQGRLKSITLLDKTDSIEISVNPQQQQNNAGGVSESPSISVTLNNKPTELPVHRNDIHAWRNFYSISVLTKYGAFVQCSYDLRICHIKINGFYYGQVRGLMGNGNSEQFDDFTLPDDKITGNYGEFINAYRLPKNCPSQVAAETAKNREQIPRTKHCTELFSLDSSLRYCYLFVKSIIYRNVCDAAVRPVAGDDEKASAAACHVAMAYAAKCRSERIPINLPAECGKCSAGKYNIDDTFSVETPQQRADIVFVVDTTGAGAGSGTPAGDIESNNYLNELIQPLIAEIRIRSKVRDISDVRIAVIGYNKYQKYFTHYSYNGKLDIVFAGGQKAGKFEAVAAAPTIDPPIKSGLTELDRLFNVFYAACKKIELDLGMSIDARAFRAAMTYPFRSEASKVIVGVRSDIYQHSVNPIRAVGATLWNDVAKLQGINVHYIGPIPELSVIASKDAKTSKTIVGFNAKQVLTMGDATKRTNIGSTDLRRNIQYGSDLGLDITQSGYGYAFSLTNFQNFKTPKDRKTFISVIATGIAEQLQRLEVYSDCKCKLYKGLFPIETCTAVETKYSAAIPAKKPGAAGRG